MIRIVVNGILGRMGQAVASEVLAQEDLVLSGGVDTLETYHADEIVVSTDADEVLVDTDVVIDFSSPAGLSNIASQCRQKKIPMVTGTTALSGSEKDQLIGLAEVVPVVQSYNFSPGINLLLNLLQQTARVLEGEYDAEIVDIHHRRKKDSPSGTALLLARTLAGAAGSSADDAIRLGRSGNDLSREDEIGIHSLRGGSVVGEHQVHFFTENENIVITHQSLSRRGFAAGAIRAAEWVVEQKPGLYTMANVLELT